MELTATLKEWAVAIDALTQGKTILLLRKGGIHETGGRFQVKGEKVLLYPTFEHQKPELLKSAYAEQINPVESTGHPQTVKITAWAEITDIFTLKTDQGDAILTGLSPFHIWRDRLIRDRFNWKPHQPLYILLLRAYKLAENQVISDPKQYGGCRSWIDLAQPISLNGSQPVLDESTYQQLVEQIRPIILSN
ncbi:MULTISPECIES: DUF1802 family protein [Planktothricoides]|uniref:DUF1802 family protein n=2 Tax=Planktothricoides raciborskii TaxID=132608 RepID=A0AAU8JKS7_9CYAN|nr:MULTISPECIES: DUF1802 family protein [Planktothricoides]KOR37242.1 hypothetical protein AM228_08590 [Planktothricoides sp. SR001]MBD2545742.1 DUF1802 family protein [Planktothricoides raciborskii FACHB-1370]MBD2582687.1 DUF1802 family protein [Planktothricoides raciborskii FACHB-1261]